jgi:hypothetical protein
MRTVKLVPWEIAALTKCIEVTLKQSPPVIEPAHLRVLLRQMELAKAVSIRTEEAP